MFNVGIIGAARAKPRNVFFDVSPLIAIGSNQATVRVYPPAQGIVNDGPYNVLARYVGVPTVQMRAVLEAGVLQANELSDWVAVTGTIRALSTPVTAAPMLRVRLEARDAITLAPAGTARFWTANAAP